MRSGVALILGHLGRPLARGAEGANGGGRRPLLIGTGARAEVKAAAATGAGSVVEQIEAAAGTGLGRIARRVAAPDLLDGAGGAPVRARPPPGRRP